MKTGFSLFFVASCLFLIAIHSDLASSSPSWSRKSPYIFMGKEEDFTMVDSEDGDDAVGSGDGSGDGDTSSTSGTSSSTSGTSSSTSGAPLTTSTTEFPDVEVPHNTINHEGSDKPCLLASLNLTISVPYDLKSGKKNSVSVNIPTSTPTTGACAGDTIDLEGVKLSGPVLVFEWSWSVPKALSMNRVVAQFQADDKRQSLAGINATILLNNDKLFPEAANPGGTFASTYSLGSSFENEGKGSYTCRKEKTFESDDGSKLTVSNVQMESGENLDASRFGEGVSCSSAALLTFNLFFLIASLILTLNRK